MSRLVIVGAGIAAVRLAQALRRRGSTDELVIVGAERHVPYDRPPLSKAVLRGERDLPELLDATAWDGLGVQLRLGVTAVGVEPGAHTLRTDAGELGYDSLIIASGARARRVPGLPGHVLRSMDDAVTLRAALTPGASVVVVGAGLIGCEVAASARALGVTVHLVDVAEAPMSRVLGAAAAELASGLHEERGVRLHLGVSARAEGEAIVVSDGTALAPDSILHAVGAAPETGWLDGSGVPCADGVCCDGTGRTAVPDVYAIGDVARWDGHRAEHWTRATEQAEHLAAALTGTAPPEPDVPYWWSDQYDVKFQGLGTIDADDDVLIRRAGPHQRPLAIFSRDGRLTGAVGVSAAGPLMRLRPAIAAGAPVADVLD